MTFISYLVTEITTASSAGTSAAISLMRLTALNNRQQRSDGAPVNAPGSNPLAMPITLVING
jgi:hypothetical protein